MIDLHLSAFAPRWRFLYAVRIDAYQTNLRITLDGTLLNGWLIGRCSRICEKIFDFQDRLSLRKFFA